MAQYGVTCRACGKAETTQIYGPSKEREWKITNYRCYACYRQDKQAQDAGRVERQVAEMLTALANATPGEREQCRAEWTRAITAVEGTVERRQVAQIVLERMG